MKIVIIEDEQLTAQRLEIMLKKYDNTMHIMAVLPSVSESVEWFKSNTDPDLIFMDIHLEDGQSFTIFEKINLDIPVIFTTAYDEYMIRAFKVNSVDYLMKPLNYEELTAAIEKYKRLHVMPKEKESMGALLQSIQPKQEYKQRFLITIGSRLKTVEAADVHYFYSAEKITFLVTKNNERFPVDFSLDKLAAVLDPAKFYRINRQMMLAIHSITNIHVYPKGRLKIDVIPDFKKEEVMVSIDKVVEFKEWLGK